MARKKLPQGQYLADVTALDHQGRGIAQLEGKVHFLSPALPNEKVEFVYTQNRRRYAEGRVVEVITPASARVEPGCPHFEVCGGCSLQHMDPDGQINLKQHVLLEQLNNIGQITPNEILPALRGPVWGYRRKARLGVKYVEKKNTVVVGFREKNSNLLAQLEVCKVLAPPVGELIRPLRDLIFGLEAKQSIPQIEVASGDAETALVFRWLCDLSEADSYELVRFGQAHDLQIYIQPSNAASIYRLWPASQRKEELLHYRLEAYGLTLFFHPSDFTQVNAALNEKMIEQAVEQLDLKKEDRVLDLFCGLGNFSLPIARQAAEVIGIEGSDRMVERATQNAQYNHIENAAFYCADLAAEVPGGLLGQHPTTGPIDKILLDPPRSGAAALIPQLAPLQAKRIVYVSCHPATLARDAALLAEQGYRLVNAGVMDMFPHTTHVEAMAVFTK